MRNSHACALTLMLTVALFIGADTVYADDHLHAEHGHESHEEEPAKGPHGGRLFSEDGLTLEVSIFEQESPPHFRVYAFRDEKSVTPKDLKVKIDLTRFGGRKETYDLSPIDD